MNTFRRKMGSLLLQTLLDLLNKGRMWEYGWERELSGPKLLWNHEQVLGGLVYLSSSFPLSSHKLSALVCWVIHLLTHSINIIVKHAPIVKCHTWCWIWWRVRQLYLLDTRVCVSGEEHRWIVKQFQYIVMELWEKEVCYENTERMQTSPCESGKTFWKTWFLSLDLRMKWQFSR